MMETGETAWRQAEADYVTARRQRLATPPDHAIAGLALSGGGIRAATFSLGVLKSLSKLKLMHRFDYISTVSGGGYTGAFYVSMFTRDARPPQHGTSQDGADEPRMADVADPLGTERGSLALRRLRENGRYLLPRGAGDAVRLATTAVRAWLAIQLVIGVTLVAFLLTGKALQATLVASGAAARLDSRLAGEGLPAWASPSRWLLGFPLGEHILLGPLWLIVAALVVFIASMAWAYWLPRYDTVPRLRAARILGPSGVGTALIAAAGLLFSPGGGFTAALRLVGAVAAGAILVFTLAETISASADRRAQIDERTATLGELRGQEDRVRNRITRWTARTCSLTAAIGAFALVDTIGQTIYSLYLQDESRSAAPTFTAGALVIAAIPLVRRVIAWAQTNGSFGGIMRRFGHLIALLAGLVLALVLTSFWSVVAEFLAWRGGPIGRSTGLISSVAGQAVTTSSLWTLAGTFVAIAVAIGTSIGFLNLSSFSAFYAGRLRRAYLGASNPERTEQSVAERDEQRDDIQLGDYYVPQTGAPLHLINITVNETMGKGSTLVQRDRKGRPLTLSPAGFLVPTDGGALRCYPLPDPATSSSGDAELPLSNWIGISGAAMSTGLGRNTSLGLALLAGLANLRLGVWWTPPGHRASAIDPRRWVQRFLAAEFFGRFAGIEGRRWYLTDGGHFENTGVYELVRRRVPMIVACDTGADPDYDFADVVNLTRKLRIDFDAELDFLPASKLDRLLGAATRNRAIFGELSQLVRLSKERCSRGPYAAIGRIQIPAENYAATLILLKPRLSGLEMIDVLDYNRINQDFPQQTTGDQFFDEAQWESYFRLGAIVGDLTFDSPPAVSPAPAPENARSKRFGPEPPIWYPASMKPIDARQFPWFADPWLGEPTEVRATSPDAPTGAPPSPGQPDAERPAFALRPSGNLTEAAAQAASRMGTGKLLAGAVAAVGSIGLATGVGQSLGNAAVPRTLVVQASPPITDVAGDDGRKGGGAGAAEPTAPNEPLPSADPSVLRTLAGAIDRLGTAVDRLPARTGGPADPRLPAEVRALRLELARHRTQDSQLSLKPLLDRMQTLGDRADGWDKKHDDHLNRAVEQLGLIATSVREAAPRRNVRGSK